MRVLDVFRHDNELKRDLSVSFLWGPHDFRR